MKKLLSLGMAIIITAFVGIKMFNKQDVKITDEEVVHAYIVAMDGEGDYRIEINDNPIYGEDYIVYTVYKNDKLMTFGEIERSYAQQFAE